MLVPFALVAKEPDLGTSLTFPVILVAMYFWAGMPLRQLLLGLSPVLNAALFFLTGDRVVVGGAGGRRCSALVRPRLSTLLVVLAAQRAAWATRCRTSGTTCTTTRSGASRPS